jgi:hypothetical protein
VFAPGAGFSASGKPTQEKGKSASPALVRVSGKDVALHHIEFDGMGSAETKQSGSLLSIGSGATGTTVLAAEFRNWNGDAALSLVGAKNVSVAGSRFRSNGSQASLTSHINVKGGSGVKLSQNLLQDSSKFGINISGCADCEAQRNVLWQSGSGKASAIVAIRAVGDTLTVRNNYVDCDVFWCNAAYFFGKSGEKAAANGAEASTITARNNVASHALAGFFFGLGSTIKAEDNLALAKAGGFSCGKRASAPFSKLTGASVEAQGRAPAIVEASFSAKGLSEQERSTCVVGTAEKQRATGDEKVLRAVAQTVFPFMLGRAPTKDERSATASQLAAGASLKELFIGLDVLKSPEPASGEVTIMANKGGGKDPEGAGTQRADRGEKMGSSAVGGPTVTIASTTTSVASTSSIVATFRFSRQVTGFGFADITATNATFQAMTPSNGVGTIFTVTLRPTVATSDVTLAVAADKALGFLAPKIGNQASGTFTIPAAYARSYLSFAGSAGPARTIRIRLPSPVASLDLNFDCQNCSVSNVRADGSAPNTYLATVNPDSQDQNFTVRVRSSTTPSLFPSSNPLVFRSLSVTGSLRVTGASILRNPNQPVSGFQRRLMVSGLGRDYYAVSYILLKSYPTSYPDVVSPRYGGYGYGGGIYLDSGDVNTEQDPCFHLWFHGPLLSPPRGKTIWDVSTGHYVSGCETLVANNSGGEANGRVLRGLFNAPYGTAGERPIDVEYSVVNSNLVAGDISQQVFPPYTVAALNFNSAGAAQRDFQTTGPAPCFLVKWRFSFPNGVYSPPETRLFCQGGPTDLYQD